MKNINQRLWKEATDFEKAEYVDMSPTIDLHGGTYTTQEGYIMNNPPDVARIFLRFNNLGKNSEVRIDTDVLQIAHDLFYELQKKTILLEREIIELKDERNRPRKLYC